MRALVKVELVAAIGSFPMIFVAALARQGAILAGIPETTADIAGKAAMMLFFCVFGFACIGLMIHVFILLQNGIGNGSVPMIRFLAEHEKGVTFFAWGFLGLGAAIAIPVGLAESGFQWPLSSSGLMIGNVGMTIDEVRRGSTLKMKEPTLMYDNSYRSTEDLVFDFQIRDSPLRFPQCRFYSINTPPNDPHLKELIIGITPRKMPKAELDAFQHSIQEKLFADGWMPGHYVADSELTAHMWGGKRTSQDGRFWRKGKTVLRFERSRMDEEKRDEPKGSGEFVVAIYLETLNADRDIVFEPSAWNPTAKE